jgi:hypothetical protein
MELFSKQIIEEEYSDTRQMGFGPFSISSAGVVRLKNTETHATGRYIFRCWGPTAVAGDAGGAFLGARMDCSKARSNKAI